MAENGPQVTVAKTVSIPRFDDPEKTAFELTSSDGEVTIKRVSTASKVSCSLEDLARAVELVK